MDHEKTTDKKSKVDRAIDTLRKRTRGIREFEVIREQGAQLKPSGGMISETYIYEPEYVRALRLKEELIRRFDGKPLQKVIPGKVVSNNYGDCYCIADECNARFKKIDDEKSRRVILSDLKLMHGVGPKWEQKLKQQGYLTLEDLSKHPKWQPSANEFLKILETKDIGSLQSWLWRHLPKSHPLAHYLAGFCNEEDFAILDIETLGLFGRPIILLGVAKPRKNKICTTQFLLRDIPDEPGALWEFLSNLDEKAAFITFNGRSFDVPFIQERFAFYGIEASLNNPHFDVLHFARRAWRNKLDDCRLETIERYFGIQRDIDVPSELIPEFYDAYLRTQNVGPLVAIVEHNKQDLLTLASLFSKLYDEWNL